MRRALCAAVGIGALVFSAPGAATAVTNCGVVVCATADATATWTCDVVNMGWGSLATCTGAAVGTGGGSSDLSIPGSATYSSAQVCRFVDSTGTEYPCGSDASQGPVTCTWAGLGEDSCSGSGSMTVLRQYGLSSGQCLGAVLTQQGVDYVMRATASSTASRSLPVIGPLDSATATASVLGSLAQQSATVCA